MIRERERHGVPGIAALAALVLAFVATVGLFAYSGVTENPVLGVMAVALFPIEVFLLRGLFIVAPNQARVLQLFGDYAGTAKVPGLRYSNPFYTRRKISLRVRNFES